MSDDNTLRNSKTLQTGDASNNRASTSQANNPADNGTEGPLDVRPSRSPIRLQYDVDKPIEISLLVPQHSEEEQLGELRPSMGSDDSIGTVSPLQQSCKNNNEDDYWIRELQRELNKLADAEKRVTDVHYTPSAVIMGSKRSKEPEGEANHTADQKSPSTCNHSRPKARYRLILSDNSLPRRRQSGASDSQLTATGKKQQEILMKIEVKPRNNTTNINFGDLKRPPSACHHQHTQTEATQPPTTVVRCTQTVESCLGKAPRTLTNPLCGHQPVPQKPHRSTLPVAKKSGLQRWGSLQETFAAAYPKASRTSIHSSLTNVPSQAKTAANPPCQVVNRGAPPLSRNVRRRLSNLPYSTAMRYEGCCGNITGEICGCVVDGNGKLFERTDNIRDTTLDAYLFDDRYYTECLQAQEEETSLPLIQLQGRQEPYGDSSFVYLNGNLSNEVSDVFSMADFYKHYKL